jgi:protocatechuate 3,4-dioxygenase, alpha subunit
MPAKMNLTPTASQTVGPYLHLGLTDVPCITAEGVKGERVHLLFRVLDGDGVPVPDAVIELWQADSEGTYMRAEQPPDKMSSAPFRGFGRIPTGENGTCAFETIKPGRVPGPGNTLQAPHINVSVLGRGLMKRLSTRVYFAGEPANTSDPALALVPENRRNTLIAQPDPARSDGWILEIRLRGEGETVFFDV